MHLTLTFTGDKASVLKELQAAPPPLGTDDNSGEVRRAVTAALADHLSKFAQDVGPVSVTIAISANYLAHLTHDGHEKAATG